MRNYKGLPSSLGKSDLDILISNEDIQLFYNIFNKVLKSTNGVIIASSKGQVPKICVLGGEDNCFYGIMFDVHHGIIPYKSADIFPVKFVFSRLNTYNKVKVFNDNDAIFIAFLKEIFYNKRCEKYFIEASMAWELNREIYLKELNKKYSKRFILLLDDVLSKDSYDFLKVKKLGVLGAKELTSGLSNKLKNIHSFFGKVNRFRHPFGYTITFLGVDGSGKTTIINNITPLLTEAVHNEVHYEHMRPNFLPSIASILKKEEHVGTVANPHEKKESGFIGSIFRLFYYSMDYIIGYWLKVYPSLVRKPSLWIFDRYFYDYLIDPKRGRIKLPSWIIKMIKVFVPSPNLIICLGGKPEILYDRKKELPLKEVKAQVLTLKAFSNKVKNAYWIDTSKTIETTINEVVELIKKNMNERLNK
ncbi:hypothetical protein [Algibacter mikhailovii]|nr:hypothetical protein [Algibacter mikhailovii]